MLKDIDSRATGYCYLTSIAIVCPGCSYGFKYRSWSIQCVFLPPITTCLHYYKLLPLPLSEFILRVPFDDTAALAPEDENPSDGPREELCKVQTNEASCNDMSGHEEFISI